MMLTRHPARPPDPLPRDPRRVPPDDRARIALLLDPTLTAAEADEQLRPPPYPLPPAPARTRPEQVRPGRPRCGCDPARN
jgi:hypothetical protein